MDLLNVQTFKRSRRRGSRWIPGTITSSLDVIQTVDSQILRDIIIIGNRTANSDVIR